MFSNLNMNKIILWLVVIMLSSFAIGAAILLSTGGISMLSDGTLSFSGKFDKNIDEEKISSISGINNININTISTDVNIMPSESNEVKAHLYGGISSSREDYFPQLACAASGDKLTIEIKWPKSGIVGYLNSHMKLDVYLPTTFDKGVNVSTSSANIKFDELKLDTFKYSTTSGNLSGKQVDASEVTISTSSGNGNLSGKGTSFSFKSVSGDLSSDSLNFKNVSFQSSSGKASISTVCQDFSFNSISGDLIAQSFKAVNTLIETSSGNVKIFGPTVDSFQFGSVSGDLTIESLNAKEIHLKTSSGKMDIKDASGNLNSDSISGDLTVEYSSFDDNIKAKSSSGNVKLKLPGSSQFYLDFSSSSGELVNNDFPITIQGSIKKNNICGTVISDKNRIEINTVSGDVKLFK